MSPNRQYRYCEPGFCAMRHQSCGLPIGTVHITHLLALTAHWHCCSPAIHGAALRPTTLCHKFWLIYQGISRRIRKCSNRACPCWIIESLRNKAFSHRHRTYASPVLQSFQTNGKEITMMRFAVFLVIGYVFCLCQTEGQDALTLADGSKYVGEIKKW